MTFTRFLFIAALCVTVAIIGEPRPLALIVAGASMATTVFAYWKDRP